MFFLDNFNALTVADHPENGVLLVQSAINGNLFATHSNVFSIGETAWKVARQTEYQTSRVFPEGGTILSDVQVQKTVKTGCDGFSREKCVYSGKTKQTGTILSCL